MIDKQNERFSLLGGKLKPFGHTLREKSARFRMRARSNGATGVVQEQSELKNERIFEIFEKTMISGEFGILCANKRVQFIDAEERVFVRGVAVKEFVLDQAGELSELRNVAAEKIDPVHQAQRAAHFAFLG